MEFERKNEMKEKLFSLVLFTFTATAAMAGASVSLGTPQQRYPWNGKMDIPYTLAGTDAAKTGCSGKCGTVSGGMRLGWLRKVA